MTNDLGSWLSRVSSTFDGAQLAPYSPERRAWLDSLLHGPAPERMAILRAFREQSAVIVLLLRNQLQDERTIDQSADGYPLPAVPTSTLFEEAQA